MINRNPRNLQLLSQISDANPFKKSLIPRLFDLASDFEKDMEATGLDRRLSPDGKKEKAQGHLRTALRDLRNAKKLLDEHHAKTETMRAMVKGPVFEKSDILAAMLRAEMRSRAVAMSPGQRHALMTGPRRSTAFLDAVLEFADDPWMSGIDNFAPDQQEIFTRKSRTLARSARAAIGRDRRA
jgi:hypothetical protein